MKLSTENLLKYWRASLSDSSRLSTPKKTIDVSLELDQHTIKLGIIPAEVTARLYRGAEKSTSHGDGTPQQGIPVIILPHLYSIKTSHGTAANRSDSIRIAPLLIQASLERDGRLSVADAKPPVFARDLLEPTSQPISFGTIKRADEFYSSHKLELPTWESTIKYAEDCFRFISGASSKDFELPNWTKEEMGRIVEVPDAVEAAHILKLYNWLLNQPEPKILKTIRERVEVLPLLSPYDEWKSGTLHVAHPTNQFALESSQRRTLMHLLKFKDENTVTVVNGPPGTGKTTLIQSIVANLWVDAALQEKKCPLIVATSTSNQAVTNVIHAFDSLQNNHDGSPLKRRWLPKLQSYGMYLASDTARTRLEKSGRIVQTYRQLPTRNTPAEHFASHYETLEGYEEATEFFLQHANQANLEGGPFKEVSQVRHALLSEMRKIHAALQKEVAHIGELLPSQDESPSLTLFDREAHRRTHAVHDAAKLLDNAKARGALLLTLESAWNKHRHSESWVTRLTQFLPISRAKRNERDTNFFAVQDSIHLSPGSSPRSRRKEFCNILRSELAQAAQQSEKSSSLLDDRIQSAKAYSQQLDVFSKWCKAHEIDGDEGGINQILDIRVRNRLFYLASHYWEAEYLQEVDALLCQTDGYRDGQSPEKLERHYRRLAKLAPCFISTLHMLPKWCRTYHKEEGYLVDAIDLLIVDEAAQVSPEIGVASLALARNVCVVGDANQIEPVQLIPETLDIKNADAILGATTGNDIDMLKELGILVSSGSLLTLAQNASRHSTHPQIARGFFLTEHRRCQPKIISYCNELIYQNLLAAKRKEEHFRHNLPQFGWLHCDSASTKRIGSHENRDEAAMIASWVQHNQAKITAAYNLTLKESLAIITPFTAQAAAIQRALSKAGLGSEKIPVGTLHTMQGAERPIVIFSPTYGTNHTGSVFFATGPRLLNVAVSRAKDSFIVIGSMELFRKEHGPCGLLGKHLFSHTSHELSPIPGSTHKFIKVASSENLIHTLREHRAALKQCFFEARKELLIVSPFVTMQALNDDGIPQLIQSSCLRGVKVRIIVDFGLNRNKPELDSCIRLLRKSGATVFVTRAKGIHCKVVCQDSNLFIAGSFNWLSAVRRESAFQRYEVSYIQTGEAAASAIYELKKQLREILALDAASNSSKVANG